MCEGVCEVCVCVREGVCSFVGIGQKMGNWVLAGNGRRGHFIFFTFAFSAVYLRVTSGIGMYDDDVQRTKKFVGYGK